MKGNIFTTKLLEVVLAKSDEVEQAAGVFIIMDFVQYDVRTLLEKVDQEQFSGEHIKIILYNLLCATNFMHTAGIMHRDIKPCNLLVDSECSVKICDFGQSRPYFLEKTEGKRRLSTHISSRWYRSPEIILTHQDYDCAIDIWSLGCVFAEIMLLNCLDPDKRKEGIRLSDVILIPGRSCYPFTDDPAKGKGTDGDVVRSDDQLIKILQLIGPLSEDDGDFLQDKGSQSYLNLVNSSVKPKGN